MARPSLAKEYEMVMLSILGTFSSAIIIFLVTIAVSGGLSVVLFKSYVLPLLLSSFTLLVYFTILYARHLGKLPIFKETEAPATPPPDVKGISRPPEKQGS